jgi:ParB-like chromosome segregation protein Spo0J
MNSFLKGIKEATADAGPDIAAVLERLETASAEADKEAASRAADIRSAAARVARSSRWRERKPAQGERHEKETEPQRRPATDVGIIVFVSLKERAPSVSGMA